MSFIVAAIATVAVSAGVSYVNGQKQQDAQRDAQAQAQRNADKAARDADIANNKANAKRPDISSLADQNAMAAKGGVGGTMLTGPGGIDTDSLKLGKNTLLGG